MPERISKELREFVPILHKNGYVKARTRGSHTTYVNRTTHKHITVNNNLNAMVRLRLIKENNLEV